MQWKSVFEERSCVYSSVRSHVQREPIRIGDGKVLRHMLGAWSSSSSTIQLCCGLVVRDLEAVLKRSKSLPKMPAKQRMRVANEKHSQNVTTRGNVPKSLVSRSFYRVKKILIWNERRS